MNKTSIASESSSSSSTAPHGLRTQLGHILPKHALFQVHLHIDQLSNVPLVSGEFGVRWKFKNVQSGSGLLGKMKGRSTPSLANGKGDKGKGRLDPLIQITPGTPDRDGFGLQAAAHDDARSSFEDEDHSRTSMQSTNSAMYGQFLSTSPPSTPVLPSMTPRPGRLEKAEAKGMTPWAPLQSYNVRWDHRVSVAVQMDVHRETGDLLPCELKLVAMQRVVHGDLNAPRQPRLGAVYINLAEYADAGPVARRYLLRESKTNATLKLTIEVEHIGGEKQYTPPPLRKGEIMASVTGLLSNNNLYQTKFARDLDMYTHHEDDDSSSMYHQPFSTQEGGADFDRLASSQGLRTTENLIDAIFNPIPTTSEHSSPFTYYDPDKARDAEKVAWQAERQSTHSSFDSGYTDGSSSSHPASVYTTNSDSTSTGSDTQPKHWWQKMRSRPSGSSPRTFRPSTPQTTEFATIPS
ncbi:N-terminal C2 domain-containing protein [Phanerochaete sordida]|uniref:N-terminal C2 domain-containing protein n=1 Tax=Phanerochaete sordida TaxID=48140 RepID=A0A9P3GCA1_9APHY|nr:N-terminal C2 domain-containing protein [Phanerochaete sordida]